MLTHLFSTALTSKVAATAATVVLIGGGAAIATEGVADDAETEGLEIAESAGDDAKKDSDSTSESDGEAKVEGEGDVSAEEEEEGEEKEFDLGALDEDGERSDTADRVHEALSGGDFAPGDEGFGEAVSKRARGGELGDLVSRAAQGEELNEDDLNIEERERPGKPEGTGDENEVVQEEPAGTSEDEDDDVEPAEAGGPPDLAKAGGRG
ncbi:MAG: hypothetical protein WD638_02395 [Nitriliruptoraceae bacterium]